MKPKNIKERRNRFIKFILLFLLTVLTIMILVFFNFKVPKKENELLKKEAIFIKKEILFQTNFSKDMKLVKNRLDSIDVPGKNVSYEDNLISTKLVALQESIPTDDNTYKYDMYITVVNLYLELQSVKKRLRKLKEAESDIEKYEEALEECRNDLKLLERELQIALRPS
ncbi:MAG: type VI secretion system transmembrane protein TssO [Flavobacteriaceae bacterium]|nr:type VI secretion system transmembrane protein TssO [Flavobacteriaceae bacterium]